MARKTKYTPDTVAQIVQLLERGNTDTDTCALAGVHVDTFYTWLKAKPEFSELVAQARGRARQAAVAAWRQGMLPTTETIDTTEQFTETRIDKNGKPYTYTRTVNKKQIINHPADWRAAEAYLKRRDPLNWSEHQTTDVTSGGEPIKLNVIYESPDQKVSDDEL